VKSRLSRTCWSISIFSLLVLVSCFQSEPIRRSIRSRTGEDKGHGCDGRIRVPRIPHRDAMGQALRILSARRNPQSEGRRSASQDQAAHEGQHHLVRSWSQACFQMAGRKCDKLSKSLTQAASVLLPRQKRSLRESAKYLKSGAPDRIRTCGLCLRRAKFQRCSAAI
jgi:hypothetical protein